MRRQTKKLKSQLSTLIWAVSLISIKTISISRDFHGSRHICQQALLWFLEKKAPVACWKFIIVFTKFRCSIKSLTASNCWTYQGFRPRDIKSCWRFLKARLHLWCFSQCQMLFKIGNKVLNTWTQKIGTDPSLVIMYAEGWYNRFCLTRNYNL